MKQLYKLLRVKYEPQINLFLLNSQGSVILSFTVTLLSSDHIDVLQNAIDGGAIGNLSVSLLKIINKMGRWIIRLLSNVSNLLCKTFLLGT